MGSAPAIFWFREDLRLADNPGLAAALSSGQPVLCVYILDEISDALRSLGGTSKWWLDKSLRALNADIERLSGQLVFRRGAALDVLASLIEESGAEAVYWNRRYGGAERAVDEAIKSNLAKQGLKAESHPGNVVAEPWTIKTKDDGPYRVFSPYWRALQASIDTVIPLPAPEHFPETEPLMSDNLDDWELHPKSPDWSAGISTAWQPGEAAAQSRLSAFLANKINHYAEDRNRPDLDATSRLSPHLRFGEISPRQIWAATRVTQSSGNVKDKPAEKFLSEVAWREFSIHLLFHYPDIPKENYRHQFDTFPWRDDDEALQAWQRGRTGYPIIDAGMRELWETGYMHNRVRMIVASFLTKHLLIHWKHGEDWFWDTLVDADSANNAASWQWTAGSGADAAPYFRIFNPITQGEKFDETRAYVRRWVPELSRLPDSLIYRPWDASPLILKAADVELGKTYPLPIVEHSAARARALDAYETIKAPKAA